MITEDEYWRETEQGQNEYRRGLVETGTEGEGENQCRRGLMERV